MSSPLTVEQIIDQYFLEHRAKVLDLAAFLDRHDRAAAAHGAPPANASRDTRIRALIVALDLLRDGQPERARRILELWSDRSTEPIPSAPMKGAIGAAPLP
jgi:hypothetical protein